MIRSSCSSRADRLVAHRARLVVVALVKTRAAQLRELAQLARILGARVAVGEVAAEVELERLRQPHRLRDRLRVLREARRHRRRRGEHMAEVPAPIGLGGVERRVQADRDERVLQRPARARVSVNVAGRHAAQARAAAPATPAAGCEHDHRADRGAAARRAGARARTPRAAAAASARRGRRASSSRSDRRGPRRGRGRPGC